MTRSNSQVTFVCASMCLAGAILLLTVHHAESTDIWANQTVHVVMDVMAVAAMCCPLIRWLREK